jgi:arabinose-5-phosphate isomerase
MKTAPTTIRHRDAAVRTIDAEIAALQRLQARLDESFEAAADVLVHIDGKLITLGVGKSGLAAQKVAATMRSVGVQSLYLSASDCLHGDLGVVAQGDVAMLFSKSGTTSELMALLPHLRAQEVILIAVVGSATSPLAREADYALEASVEREGCPLDAAPMASVLAAQAMGDALAAAITTARGFTAEDFARLHPAGALGARLTLTVADVMRRGRELPRVEAGASLKAAVLEITRTGYGAVCVVDEADRLVGFVTDGDVRRQLAELDDLSACRVDDIMTKDPLQIAPEVPLSQALLTLEQRSKPYLTAPVVLEDGRCVGLLRLHDTVQVHLNG